MTLPPTARQISLRSPSAFPQGYDPIFDVVQMVAMSAELFRDAAFLDMRLFRGQQLERGKEGFLDLEARTAALDLKVDCGLILHLGHVGSTLVSRLLGAHDGVLAIREPAALRTLGEMAPELERGECVLSPGDFDRRLNLLLRMWSRTYRPDQLAVIKATSLCSEIAGRMLMAGRVRALAMISPPEIFLAGLLGGQAVRGDLRLYAGNRIARLHRRLDGPRWLLGEMSLGEIAAMSWASEMCALAEAAAAGGGLLRWQDFDQLLAAPGASLSGAFAWFGREVASGEVEAIVSGPLMRQYSKSPDLTFGPRERQATLRAARASQGEEIARGLAWLDRAAAAAPKIAEAIAIAEQAAATAA